MARQCSAGDEGTVAVQRRADLGIRRRARSEQLGHRRVRVSADGNRVGPDTDDLAARKEIGRTMPFMLGPIRVRNSGAQGTVRSVYDR